MEHYSPWMQSPAPAATAKNFGLPAFRVIVCFCWKPQRHVHGRGETSATAGCLSAMAGMGSVQLHPLAPFLALTESFPPSSDSTAATWGSTWLPRETAFLICVAGLQQAWHRGNIYISFCNVVAAAAILGTEVLAGSGERGTKHTMPHWNQGGRKKKKKENRQPASSPRKLVVFWVPGVLLALQMVTAGPICLKVSQWKLQLRMPATGPDLSLWDACAPGGAGQGKGSPQARWLSVLHA